MSYVIRTGRERGKGEYWTQPDPDAVRCEFSASREKAVRYGTYSKACQVAGNLSNTFVVRVVHMKRTRPRQSFYPEGAFAPGELACVGRDPNVASEFYGGLCRLVERTSRLGGIYWTADMIEPYRNGRYEFRESFMMRVAPVLPSKVPTQAGGDGDAT